MRQLHAFHAVAEERGIGAAARAVRLSQPALSQSIRKLEDQLGVPLVARGRTGVDLTAQGFVLKLRVDRFRDILRSILSASVRGAAANTEERHLWHLTMPQIRSTIAMADAGSFAAAAALLAIAESSVHRAARDLEALVGRPLYQRTLDGIRMTRHGRSVARHLRLALRELEQAIDELNERNGTASGRLLIGTLPLAKTHLLPRAIHRVVKAHPNATVHVMEGAYDRLLSDLLDGKIDVLIGALRNPAPADDALEEQLFVDRFSIVARAGHPLAGRSGLSVEDLASQDWVIARAGTPIHAVFDRLFEGLVTGRPAIASVETSSLLVIRSLLAESNRLTILSRRQIAFEERHGVLAALAFDLPSPDRPIGFTVRRHWLPSPLHDDFLQLLRSVASEVLETAVHGRSRRDEGSRPSGWALPDVC